MAKLEFEHKVQEASFSIRDVCQANFVGHTFKVLPVGGESLHGAIVMIAYEEERDRYFPVELMPNPGTVWGLSGEVVEVRKRIV